MDKVTFPGFGLEFNIKQEAFSIGSFSIYWYAILMMTGFIMAIIIAKIKDGKYDIKFSDCLDLCIFIIPATIVFARLYYILFNLEYYISDPSQIFNLRSGGLAIYGGLIGGVITCIIFCKIKKISLIDLFDFLVPMVALGQAIGRWGNFVNIEAYGTKTNLPWRMGIIEGTEYTEVHPTFLYESIATFIIFIVLTVISKKRKFKRTNYIFIFNDVFFCKSIN